MKLTHNDQMSMTSPKGGLYYENQMSSGQNLFLRTGNIHQPLSLQNQQNPGTNLGQFTDKHTFQKRNQNLFPNQITSLGLVKSQGVFGNHDVFSNEEENFDKLSGIGQKNQYRSFKEFINEKDVHKIHKESKINSTQESLIDMEENLK